MPPKRTWSSNGGGNLFLEADPDTGRAQANRHHPRGSNRRRCDAARGPGRIAPVSRSFSDGTAADDRPDSATFTRPAKRPGGLQAKPREQLRRADASARRLVAQLAGRPYRALHALTMVGATLLAVSWMGLALRNAAAARHNANRRATAAASALRHERTLAATAIKRDQTRIATLYSQLEQARAAQRQRLAPVTPAAALRSRRKPAHGNAHGE